MSTFSFNSVGFLASLGIPVVSLSTAFFEAAGIVDSNQKLAVNTLVKNLQNAGLWDKMIAIYPFVGGTQQAHVLNLKDPRNNDAAYRLSLYSDTSAITNHDANGMQFKHTWANTFFNPLHNFNPGKGDHISVYVRYRDLAESGDLVDMGSYQGGDHHLLSSADPVVGSLSRPTALAEYHAGYTVFQSATQGMGYYVLTGMGSNTQGTFYENGVSIGVVADATGTPPNLPFYIGTLNLNGSAYVVSTRQYAFCTIGDYLSSGENVILYNIIQQFQTTLGRAI